MRVDVTNRIGVQARIAQRTLHGAAGAVQVGRGHVACVGAHAKADQFGVDGGAALLGVLVLFKNQHTRAFAQHEAIALGVPGARSGLGIVVARGQRPHRCKAANAQRADGGLGAAGQHDVGVAVLDQAAGLPDAMQPGGAGGGDRQVRPLEAELHRYVPGHHVDDGSRHKKWRDAARTARHPFTVRLFDHGQTANAGADHAADSLGQLFTQCVAQRQTSVLHRLCGGHDAVMDECIHGAQLFRRYERRKIEPAHLARNTAGEGAGIEARYGVYARTSGQYIGPVLCHRVANGADAT